MVNQMTIAEAHIFADIAHKGQVRKYTGEPYITHPVHVASVLTKYCPDVSSAMICAALLHDVVEDCDVSLEDIKTLFGDEIKELVYWLTDEPAVPGGPDRAARKQLAKERYKQAPAEAQTIKCADIISNTASIVQHDPKFAKVYLKEIKELLEVLTKADPAIHAAACEMIP